MFKDTEDGKTHYENDECGEPAHNKKEHKHIWKYTVGSNIKVCEAPFPFIESCGLEIMQETIDEVMELFEKKKQSNISIKV